jgi:GNAT superfamily N-acetyltransferase
VFLRGFTFVRSVTHPYLAKRLGGLWVMRDGQRRSGKYRNEEWVVYGLEPGDADRVARKHTRGRFELSVIHEVGKSDEDLRSGYRDLGYRLGTTEPLMVHRLQKIPNFKGPAGVEIQRVVSAEMAQRLAKTTKSRPIPAEDLQEDSRLRQYVAVKGEKIVGWVKSIEAGDSRWCSHMQVLPEFRRRGIGRAMLCRMLRDDRRGGASAGVLLSSHAGAKLYPIVGYEQIATLYMFMPRKKKA